MLVTKWGSRGAEFGFLHREMGFRGGEGRAWVVFGALAEEGRWKVARLLGKEGTLSLGEVMVRSGLPKWTASRYLPELWRAGIVDRYSAKEDGRQRVYRLTEVGAGLVQAGALLEG
jgi:predicted transcriptional regulator